MATDGSSDCPNAKGPKLLERVRDACDAALQSQDSRGLRGLDASIHRIPQSTPPGPVGGAEAGYRVT